MSNEISSPKVLLCPQDRERTRCATNFVTDLTNRKLSYFLGLDVNETNALAFLLGDRTITNGFPAKNGSLLLTTNQTVGWTERIHINAGNISFADGSVGQFARSGLQRALARSEVATNRLAIP